MQSVSSRIWTRVAVSNSYDDNDYTTGTSTGTITSGESESRSNWDEEVFYPPESSWTRASPSDLRERAEKMKGCKGHWVTSYLLFLNLRSHLRYVK